MSPRNNKQSERKSPSLARRVVIGVLAVIQFALLGAAMWDLRNRPTSQINGTKWMWTPVLFINFVGPIAYFLVGRKS